MKTLTLHIDGMSCGHCLNAVNKALAGLDGVEVETVTMGRAEVRFDPGVVDASRIAAAVSDAGYAATPAAGTA
jgi:copper chaperone